jgi:hypothetical protein
MNENFADCFVWVWNLFFYIKYPNTVFLRKYMDLRTMKQIRNLRYYIKSNFKIYTGHLALLE